MELDEQAIGILLEARLATKAGSSCLPTEDDALKAVSLNAAGLLDIAGTSEMPPHITYKITEDGAAKLATALQMEADQRARRA